MQCDLPHVLYKNFKKNTDSSKNTKASEKVLRLQEEANRQALERQRKRELEQQAKGPDKSYEREEIFK